MRHERRPVGTRPEVVTAATFAASDFSGSIPFNYRGLEATHIEVGVNLILHLLYLAQEVPQLYDSAGVECESEHGGKFGGIVKPVCTSYQRP